MRNSTSSHPPSSHPDATTEPARSPRLSAPSAPSTTEFSSLKMTLRAALRQFPDFPSKGILFEDILPIFADPWLHDALLRALEMHITSTYGPHDRPEVIVGLEARGFLFGPSLALRLGAAFVPVRKRGKLPGPVETALYQKEYGDDEFQMQKNVIKPGQKVLVVDDIIATGESWTLLRSFSVCLTYPHISLTSGPAVRRLCRCRWHARPKSSRMSSGICLHSRP